MITLKQYAAAMAAIDAGKPLLDVIATFDLDLAGWEAAYEHWRGHLQTQAERGERAAVEKYLATYNRQRAAVERELAERVPVASDAATRDLFAGDDDTAPMTPEGSVAPPPAGRTEPMSAEALAAFQAALGDEHAGLPFKPDDWTLERYATLEEQVERHPGALTAVWASFGIDSDQYIALRKRFAAALKEHRQRASRISV